MARRRLLLPALVTGFGIALAMWSVGFVCHLTTPPAPQPVLLGLFVLALLGGGYLAGRSAGDALVPALGGGVASLLNLMVLGSVMSTGKSPNQLDVAALWWVPASVAAGAALAAAGGALGARGREPAGEPNWTGRLAIVGAAATVALIVIGGLVTSEEAGLAVVDWPNTEGYLMWLYPLKRMLGGIYYEHSHRLFGTLVGLTTLCLAIHLARTESRRWVKRFAFAALLLVIVQGILGGLRVTGKFTLSTSRAQVHPSIALAVVHGALGQIFLGTMICLAAFTSRTFRSDAKPVRTKRAGTDRALTAALVLAIVPQLVFGALQRHIAPTGALHIHITGAVVVLFLAAIAGLRAWGLHAKVAPVRQAGVAVLWLIGIQFTLGFAALIAAGATEGVTPRPLADVILTTAHQAVGALLLAAAVLLAVWTRRMLMAPPAPAPTPEPGA